MTENVVCGEIELPTGPGKERLQVNLHEYISADSGARST